MAKKLRPRDIEFVKQFFKTGNASESYRIAFNYSGKNADVFGERLMRKDGVRRMLAEFGKKAADEAGVTASEVIRGLKRISDLDMRDLYDESGCLKPVPKWPEHIAKAVLGIKHLEDGGIEVKLEGRSGAWIALGKHLKMFADQLEVKMDISFSERLRRAREKRLKGES